MLKLTLLRVVVVDSVEKVLVEVRPLLESKLLAEHTWRDVACDEGCLDDESTRTTHRVDEVGIALPTRHQNHTSCQYLVQRSLYALLTIATTMQALAT